MAGKLRSIVEGQAGWVLAAVFATSLAVVAWHTIRQDRLLVEASAIDAARLYAEALSEFRSLYTSEVVDRLRESNVEVVHDYDVRSGSVPLPATMTILLGERIGDAYEQASVRLYSPYPFPWRATDGGLRDDFARAAWAAMVDDGEDVYYRFEETDAGAYLRYGTADRMQTACVTCHNNHEATPRADWEVGDVRGVLEIRYPLDQVVALQATGRRTSLILLATVFALGVIGIGMVFYTFGRREKILDRLVDRRTKELAVSENRIRSVVASIVEAVILISEDGKIRSTNAAAEEMFGYSESELVGRNVSLLMPSPYHEEHDGYLKNYLETGDAKIIGVGGRRLKGLRRDGEVFDMELAVSESHAGDDRVFTGIVRDITATKLEEDRLLSAREAADEANRSKSEFLANMSHEIRTPMNGVIGMTALVLETHLTQQQREYLLLVQNSAHSLLDTINGILDFSKIEAGRMELEHIGFTFSESMAGALKPLALAAHARGCRLLYDEGPDIPQRLRGDPGRLRQVLVNLVGNAVKFTDEGEVRVSVRQISSSDSRVTLRFEVADTGIGIPKERLDHIFEPFRQADGSTTRRFGGTGLGLTIVAQMVEMMGGEIGVESEVGRGSSFHFTAEFQRAQPLDSPGAAPARGLDGLRAIVVDAHDDSRRITQDVLERRGMETVPASSGSEALRALGSASDGAPTAIAVIDAQLPEMDGFTLVENIRREPRLSDLSVVILTAAGQPGDGERCLELGITSYLMKPVTPAELADAVALTLAQVQEPEAERTLVTRHSLREASSPLHVLLAEDNRVNQIVATHLLTSLGHTHRVAQTGVEVLESMAEETFDLILMDVQMPELDGLETTSRIREREAIEGGHIPIVAMTAHALVGDRERVLESGMDDYISKPVKRERLQEVLGRVAAAITGADEVERD